MEKLISCQLGDLIEFKNGKAIKPNDGVFPIYGGNGVLGYSSEFNAENSLIIGRVGAYCGSVFFEKNKFWVSDNAILGIPKNNINAQYAYYLLKQLDLNSKHVGSSQPLLTQGILSPLNVSICSDLPAQQKIAHTLSILDRKIALNQQINAKLEAMAKTLYDYWFMQFDFPNSEGKPYRSSGGEMVWCEELKREVPEGWACGTLQDFLTIKNGRDHKHLSDGKYPVYGSGGLMRCVDEYLYQGESVLMPRKGTLNNVLYVNEAFWTVDTMFYSEMKISNVAKYVFYSIKDFNFMSLNTGTGVPSMTSSILYSLLLLKPTDEILAKFENVISPIYKAIKANAKQTQKLTQLRDFLLPMLMNGQVGVR